MYFPLCIITWRLESRSFTHSLRTKAAASCSVIGVGESEGLWGHFAFSRSFTRQSITECFEIVVVFGFPDVILQTVEQLYISYRFFWNPYEVVYIVSVRVSFLMCVLACTQYCHLNFNSTHYAPPPFKTSRVPAV